MYFGKCSEIRVVTSQACLPQNPPRESPLAALRQLLRFRCECPAYLSARDARSVAHVTTSGSIETAASNFARAPPQLARSYAALRIVVRDTHHNPREFSREKPARVAKRETRDARTPSTTLRHAPAAIPCHARRGQRALPHRSASRLPPRARLL